MSDWVTVGRGCCVHSLASPSLMPVASTPLQVVTNRISLAIDKWLQGRAHLPWLRITDVTKTYFPYKCLHMKGVIYKSYPALFQLFFKNFWIPNGRPFFFQENINFSHPFLQGLYVTLESETHFKVIIGVLVFLDTIHHGGMSEHEPGNNSHVWRISLSGSSGKEYFLLRLRFYSLLYEHWCMKSAIVKNKKKNYYQMWFYDVPLEYIKS